MSVRQLWEGCDAAVWARKMDGRTKLLILFLVAVLAIVVDNPRTYFLLRRYYCICQLVRLFINGRFYQFYYYLDYGDLCLVRHYFLRKLQGLRYLF